MELQLRSLAASSNLTEDVSIPQGKVESVCREWLVREDGVLAYKLQSEEIQHHYGHNKERNQLVRADFLEARSAQKSEEDEAAAMHYAYEKMLKEQEDQDAFLAQQLQEKILKEEMEQQKRIEEEDQRIALELQKKEKMRLQRKREERELRQAEKARAELSGASNSSSVKSMEDVIGTKEAATSPMDARFSLLSLEPPENLTPEEFQEFVKRRDAELARLLQDQEARVDGRDDHLAAIEAQDRELARVLQEQERAKARKARERARQKAAQLESQRSPEASAYRSESPEKDTAVKERNPDWSPPDRRSYASGFCGEPVTNIAAAIDPTYHHSSHAAAIITSVPRLMAPPLHSPLSELSSPGDDSSEEAPPYMPIQGTRRPTSLEKSKKSKRSKEGCKTQ